MNVVCVAGARPNFMKIKPVVEGLERRDVVATIVHTGQHYDETLSNVFFEELGIRSPDHSLNVGSGTHAEQTARVMTAFEPLLDQLAPDVVVVVGDVNSTVACALVAAKSGCLVAHVEAGLRSRDWSMPEEINRMVTDRVSDYLFASVPDAVDNLSAEGYGADQILLVGNVMVDTLLQNLERARQRRPEERLGLGDGSVFGLVTLHRPSNVDDYSILDRLVGGMGQIAAELPLVFPVHPRTRARLTQIDIPRGLHLIEPLGYLDFLGLEAAAAVVLTDSGGVQEETTVLGVPCLTLRSNTERPITVTEGTNRIVGQDPDRIVEETRRALHEERTPKRPPLWDGASGERIAEALISDDRKDRLRPSELRPGAMGAPRIDHVP